VIARAAASAIPSVGAVIRTGIALINLTETAGDISDFLNEYEFVRNADSERATPEAARARAPRTFRIAERFMTELQELTAFTETLETAQRHVEEATIALFRTSARERAVARRQHRTDGERRGGGAPEPQMDPDDRDRRQQNAGRRIQRTRVDVVKYFNELRRNDRRWQYYKGSGNKKAYRNSETGEIRYNDDMHNEIECFDSSRRHSVLDPITGERLNKPPHDFPDWLR
jgi:hypothetical protein